MGKNVESYLGKLQDVISEIDVDQMEKGVSLIEDAWKNGRQIITLGNGGSSLTALHFINDWNKSIFLASGKPFRGRCLCGNMGIIMAYGNDISFADVFSEQLKNILEPDDLVIAISGSGNSENVLRAVNYANSNGATTLGICGYDGGQLKDSARHNIWVNIGDMQLAEDAHFFFGHIVMQKLCGY